MKKIQYILSTLFLAVMAVSCSQDMDIDNNQGYLSLKVSSLVSTQDPGTRAAAPANYDPKTLHVEIQNDKGVVVKSTDNFATDEEFQGNILLEAGYYTIVAHSANWDGNGSGFDVPYYYGSTKILVEPKSAKKAEVTCTLANVKLTVNYDQSFVEAFKSATTTINSTLNGISPLQFVMKETTRSGYIPAEPFYAAINVVNKSDVPHEMICDAITDVKPRDHYIFNIKLQKTGELGDGTDSAIKVEIDNSTNTYTFTFQVPKKSAISLVTRAANAWSNLAYLSGSVTAKTSDFENAGLAMQWQKIGDEEWNTISNESLTIDSEDNVTTVLKGLTPATSYQYRLCYNNGDDLVVCDPVTFTTETQTALYNGGFEYWHQSGNPWYPNEEGVKFWDTSNPGSTTLGASYNVTTRTDSPKRSGSYAAKLESTKVVIKFAAASMYTGVFGATIGTSGAWLNWGTPFTSRPTALKGYMQYHPKAIDNAANPIPSGAPAKGEQDVCSIYIALLTETIRVDNTDMSSFPDLNTDPRIVAYGALPDNQCVATGDSWKEVNIPLVYRDVNKKPTHLLVVFSASKYGDYFHGAKGSTLYLDDFSLEYGDTPSVK